MKGYKELSSEIVFTYEDALKIFKNRNTTYSALKRLINKGLLIKIRNNLYSCINPLTNKVFANKYQIASNINDCSCVSYNSALSYYGYQNQVSNFLYVSSLKRFNDFEFEGITYKYVKANSLDGVIQPEYTYKIKITDLEKTMIDSIYSIDRLISLDELLNNFELINKVNPECLLKYLKIYNIQSLFQKTAFILSLFRKNLKLDDEFFKAIESYIHKGITYLNVDAKYDGCFIKKYNLVIPKYLMRDTYEV